MGGGRGGQKIGCYFHCWQFRFRGISSAVPSSVELNKSSSSNGGKGWLGEGPPTLAAKCKETGSLRERASSAWNKSLQKPESQHLLKQDVATEKQNTDRNPPAVAAWCNCRGRAPLRGAGCGGGRVAESRKVTWLPTRPDHRVSGCGTGRLQMRLPRERASR